MLRNASDLGSSPRVRGKQRHGRGGRRLLRLIPARAGKTRHQPRTPRGRRAHPRACGENTLWVMVSRFAFGSSPRVRGKHVVGDGVPLRVRLIPARAGKTFPCVDGRWRPSAHPRACGENIFTVMHTRKRGGSSPRVRGKHLSYRVLLLFRRLIPARAGKTTRRPRGRGCPWAHPRACGENDVDDASGACGSGSSPRVRGKPVQVIPDIRLVGLIPARAGKTVTFSA